MAFPINVASLLNGVFVFLFLGFHIPWWHWVEFISIFRSICAPGVYIVCTQTISKHYFFKAPLISCTKGRRETAGLAPLLSREHKDHWTVHCCLYRSMPTWEFVGQYWDTDSSKLPHTKTGILTLTVWVILTFHFADSILYSSVFATSLKKKIRRKYITHAVVIASPRTLLP